VNSVYRQSAAAAAVPSRESSVNALMPNEPRLSPVVFVSDDSRAAYPWLPARVIARSVWKGPGHMRVRVDGSGNAAPWPYVPETLR
jgi:hypothetical protein